MSGHRAVGMLEREALLYQHQQALRAERLEANSVSSGDSSRCECGRSSVSWMCDGTVVTSFVLLHAGAT